MKSMTTKRSHHDEEEGGLLDQVIVVLYPPSAAISHCVFSQSFLSQSCISQTPDDILTNDTRLSDDILTDILTNDRRLSDSKKSCKKRVEETCFLT